MSVSVNQPLSTSASEIRHDWALDEVNALFAMPFNDLLFKAQCVHLSLIHI